MVTVLTESICHVSDTSHRNHALTNVDKCSHNFQSAKKSIAKR